jgi:transcription antitermination factor NusG
MPDKKNYKGDKSRVSQGEKSPAGEKKWHVFYLRPRAENRVYRILMNLNYEVFWPVIHSIRIWKNRQKKKIRLPLFPNYLFVYTHAHELYSINCLREVVSYVACGGKPSTVSDREVEGIRRMLGLGREITVETKISIGERVRILSGPLKGYEGVLIEQHSKTRFGIQLKAINHTVFIDINQLELEKL